MMGVSAEKITQELTKFGDAAALSLYSPDVGMERITRAMRQIGAKGRFLAEEGEQLAEAGINLWPHIAAILIKPIPEAMMIARQGGLISADVAFQAFDRLARDPKYRGGMAKIGQTFAGRWAALKDQLAMSLGQVGLPLFEELKTGMVGFLNFLQSDAGKGAVTGLAAAFNFLRNVVGVFTDMLGHWTSAFAAGFLGVTAVVRNFSAVLAGLRVAFGFLAAHPAIVTLTALGGALAFARLRAQQLNAEFAEVMGRLNALAGRRFTEAELRREDRYRDILTTPEGRERKRKAKQELDDATAELRAARPSGRTSSRGTGWRAWGRGSRTCSTPHRGRASWTG
jgi:hypothetical protein